MQQFRFISLFLLFHLPLLSIIAQADRQKAIDQFINTSGFEHASIGFCVKDFSGNIIANHNMSNSLTPASTMKIVTTATAFEVLGANYRYETTLAKDIKHPNRLLIVGSGDPTLGTEHLKNDERAFTYEWSDAIAKAFPNNKELDILVVDNYFGYRGISRKWIHEVIGNYYAAAAYGISIFDNTYRLTLNTEKKDSAPEIIETKPQMDNIKFTNTLSLNTTGSDNGYILGAPLSNERTIIGDIPANRKKFTIKGDIPNPGLYLGETIANILGIKNIQVANVGTSYQSYQNEMYLTERTKYAGSTFHIHQSPILSEIAKEINVKSNNHYAEHLIRTIGRSKNSDIYSLALEEGIEKTNELWTEKGINTDALFMYDGCGLSPNNAISAELLCNILAYMQTKSTNSVPFLSSFAKAGEDGTVRNFLKGSILDGKMYVKSGSIANVQCYAGYYIDGDKKYSFSIMVNNYHIPRRQVVRAIEKLLVGVLH